MEKRLHIALINASAIHKKRGRQEFQKLNLSEGLPKVLSCLMENDGIVQKDLAEKCNVEPATMTTLLRKLLSDGLIRKETTYISGGKRAFTISLTALGRSTAKKVNQIVDSLEFLCYQGFSEDEKLLLVDLLDRITKNLSQNS